jgi:hypothetical protein
MSDPLVELEQLLPQIAPAVERRRLGVILGQTAEKLRGSDYVIKRFRAVLGISRTIDFKADPNQAAAENELITDGNNLASDLERAQTADDLRDIQTTYGEFAKSLANVERQLRSHWSRIVQREFRPLISVGTLLERIGSASELGKKLRQCGEEATGIRESVSADVLHTEIIRLRNLRASLDAERTTLSKDREVDAFLNALAEGGATLQMVTERVLNWLQQNGALDQFIVRPS